MKTHQNAQRSTFNVQRSTSPVSASPRLCVKNSHSRRGATLLVTLGILTVITALAVAFLSVSRLQRQTAVTRRYRDITRNQLNEALHLAMRTVEDALCYTNFTSEPVTPSDSGIVPQRLAPVGLWFSQKWQEERGELSRVFSFQLPGVLTVPVSNHTADIQAAWTVNLLTPDVLSRVPPALTNGLRIASSAPAPRFRSGWEIADPPGFQHNGARIAFVVFDVSGFIDANAVASGPTTQKLPRVCFSQADVTNWLVFAESQNFLSNLTDTVDLSRPETIPFSSLSYDPDPGADALASNSADPNPYLGFGSFPFPSGVGVADRRTLPRKFDINSVTNLIGTADSESGNWLMSENLMGAWLRPVASALTRANANETESNPDKLGLIQTVSVPWNILNFIDEDRVPQLSLFAGLNLSTRHNAAVEDVPLINKVTVFDIGEAPDGHDAAYYGISNYADPGENSEGKVSNHYAVAVELWYPFAPHSPPPSAALYAGIYSNAFDVGSTTTNRPLSRDELEDWFRWNEAASSNTVMQTLFYAWADAYTNAVGPSVWQHPLWQTVTTNAEAWFTTNMVNHPSWPVPDETGHITITNTPIWNAFYPDTYEVVTTNQVEFADTNGVPYLVDLVTTNVYTYSTTTNAYVHWVSEPDMTTNRLIGQLGVTDPDPYPVLLWSDLDGTTLTTNVLWGFTDPSGATNQFFSGDQTNHLLRLYATPPGTISAVFSNGLTGAVSDSDASSLVLAPWTADAPLAFSVQTNLYVETEILPVEPLPMPPELGATLDALFGILLAPEFSLDTSDELYDFLMLLPSEFGDRWDSLLSYLESYPVVQNTIMPVYSEATLGNLSDEDRIDLTEPLSNVGNPNEVCTLIDPLFDNLEESAEVGAVLDKQNNGFGTYWVVYPRRTVCFPEITTVTPADESSGAEEIAVTNYFEIGSKSDYRVWFRPVVTVNTNGPQERATDSIVDEALLDGTSVRGWDAVTNICVADSRHNAYADYWRGFPQVRPPTDPQDPPDWDSAVGTTNLSSEVNEYPFIHFNAPLASIGEIGHVYTSPDRLSLTRLGDVTPSRWQGDRNLPLHDTVSFASRSGAALLDLFTVHATPSNLPPWQTGVPWRGLVQANTHHDAVIQTLFSYGSLGWTNATAASDLRLTTLGKTRREQFAEAYLDALTNTPPAGMGWRSFADMLPSISTNKEMRATFEPPFDDTPAHDWIEDALRHLPDRVSFRQNIYMIVIAAQTLSSASSVTRPIVLSDQRAAVTVIRDAYTGRWTVHAWQWLTD